jgi:PadR family transcriptional regulator PadR
LTNPVPCITLYLVRMDNKIKQLRKGILELAILGALTQRRHYGYSLIRHLTGGNGIEITEGTIYPILSRLSREGLVTSDWMESHQGPPRKYYSPTPKGQKAFQTLQAEFNSLQGLVDRSLGPVEEEENQDAETPIDPGREDDDDR